MLPTSIKGYSIACKNVSMEVSKVSLSMRKCKVRSKIPNLFWRILGFLEMPRLIYSLALVTFFFRIKIICLNTISIIHNTYITKNFNFARYIHFSCSIHEKHTFQLARTPFLSLTAYCSGRARERQQYGWQYSLNPYTLLLSIFTLLVALWIL